MLLIKIQKQLKIVDHTYIHTHTHTYILMQQSILKNKDINYLKKNLFVKLL